ncbi:MAG: type II toxin-antitoxin system VapC family toxin [Pseudomonadota bacterium]
MRLLLDTHVLLWAVLNDPRLSAPQAAAITSAEVYVSAASVWEIGIKRALGKLDVPRELFDVAVDAGCRPLPISWTHAETAAALPLHHADPFDRMLIAQAQCEGLHLASSDRKLAAYDVALVS